MLDVEHFLDGDCVITIDGRRMPTVIVTWRGEPTEHATRSYFTRIVDVCRAAGRKKFVAIVDTRAALAPTLEVTRLLGDLIAESRPVAERVMLGSVVVVKNTDIGDALSAIQWSLRGDTRIVTVEEFSSAFEIANGLLRRAEITPCEDVSVPLYELPFAAQQRR